jgi:hypothetical protein
MGAGRGEGHQPGAFPEDRGGLRKRPGAVLSGPANHA